MKIPYRIEQAFIWFSDLIFGRLPRPEPRPEMLRRARLIAHRGIYDNRVIHENTIAAFDAAKSEGLWGIEFDIRWTSDFQPVVFHDPDCGRLFGKKVPVGELTLKSLRARFPNIPTLSEVIDRFGGVLHLMAELKPHPLEPERLNALLFEQFSSLLPVGDFHLLSLNPHIISTITFVPPKALLPLAEINTNRLSDWALRKGYAGMAGHYWLLRASTVKKLTGGGLQVGTGFINSKNCLYREVNRGVAWIFSDRPALLRRLMPE